MIRIVLGVLAGCVIGAAATHWVWEQRNERELASMIVLNQMEDTIKSVSQLELLEAERYATARKVQRLELDASIDSAYRWTSEFKVDLSRDLKSAPNLRGELQRAQRYLERVSPESRSRAWLDKVLVNVAARPQIGAALDSAPANP